MGGGAGEPSLSSHLIVGWLLGLLWVGLPDKIQDVQLNLDFRYVPNLFLSITKSQILPRACLY